MTGHLIGVAVFIFRGAKVLVGQRLNSHGAGTWAFAGGTIDVGEDPADAAVREVREETSIVLDRRELSPYSFSFTHEPDTGRRYTTLYYSTVYWGSAEPVVMEPSKCAEWRWVLPHMMPRPLFAPLHSLAKHNPSFRALIKE